MDLMFLKRFWRWMVLDVLVGLLILRVIVLSCGSLFDVRVFGELGGFWAVIF